MENKLTRLIYDNSPPLLKDVFASIYGWQKNRIRFGRSYDKWCSFFEETSHWSMERLLEFQEEKLRELVEHCYEHVPYYRDLFDRLKLKPADIRRLEDLKKLPILEKAHIRDAGTSLISDTCRADLLIKYPTSGCTGTPLQLYWSLDMENMEFASMWTRRRHGMKRGDPYSTFTGLEIVEPSRRKPPFWRNNWAANQRSYSIFHMNDKTLPCYFESLNSRYNKFYAGYSSAIYVIADYMEQNGLKLGNPPEAVFSASEELQTVHKEKIEQVLGCKVWNHYGLGELVASINEFPCGHMHYEMDYSIIEFLKVGEEDGLVKAEVIGTHLYHKDWPLLRYRTGDLVLFDPNDRCEEGVPGTIIRRVYGRTGHYFLLPDGSRIHNISVIAKKCRNVQLMQVVQEYPGEITVRVVPDEKYSADDEREAEVQFRRKLGNEIAICFRYIKDIERTTSGKYLSIINRIGEQ